jgi:transglycosylase-like protein with SLT domain
MDAKTLITAAILRAADLVGAEVAQVDAELLAPIIVEESEVFGFDPHLTVAMIAIESKFDRLARNAKTGALGYMQILRGGAVPDAMGEISDRALMYPRRNIGLGLADLARKRELCRSGKPERYLSLYGGSGKCRPTSYSFEVMKVWLALNAMRIQSSPTGTGKRGQPPRGALGSGRSARNSPPAVAAISRVRLSRGSNPGGVSR